MLPLIEIIRVQDVALVPPIGMLTVSDQFLRDQEFGLEMPVFGAKAQEQLGGDHVYWPNYVRVTQLTDGLVVHHPYSRSHMIVSVKAFGTNRGDQGNALDRFAFFWNPEGKLDSVDAPIFTLVKTPTVQVSVDLPRVHFLPVADPDTLKQWFAVYEVSRLAEVPAQGGIFIPPPGRLVAPSGDPQGAELVSTTVIDVGLSAIPIVGNLIDLAELTYGVVTGKNKWGRPLTKADLLLLGLGVAFPFLVKGAAKIPSLMRKVFGDRSILTAGALLKLQKARPTSSERKVIEASAKEIARGGKPALEAVKAAEEVIARVEESVPSIENLLTPDGKGFMNETLQTAYVRYSKSEAKYAAEGPAKWAKVTRQPEAMRIFENELGKNFRDKPFIDERMFNPYAVPIPPTLTAERASAALQQLDADLAKTYERASQYVISNGADELVLSRLIDGGSFRILKGNVAEVLSKPIQMEILAKIAEENPGKIPVLISGVNIQLARDGKLVGQAKLFSDNIIALRSAKGLEILGVVEVKSGLNGGLHATEQVFTWIEKRIEPGSHLILPAGSTMTTPKGVVAKLTQEQVFSYGRSPGVKEFVYNLTSAKRILITAKGMSHLGIDSASQIGRLPGRYDLAFTSQELDAIVAQLLIR